MKTELCLRNEVGCIVAWLVGYSDEDIEHALRRHPNWYRSSEEVDM